MSDRAQSDIDKMDSVKVPTIDELLTDDDDGDNTAEGKEQDGEDDEDDENDTDDGDIDMGDMVSCCAAAVIAAQPQV